MKQNRTGKGLVLLLALFATLQPAVSFAQNTPSPAPDDFPPLVQPQPQPPELPLPAPQPNPPAAQNPTPPAAPGPSAQDPLPQPNNQASNAPADGQSQGPQTPNSTPQPILSGAAVTQPDAATQPPAPPVGTGANANAGPREMTAEDLLLLAEQRDNQRAIEAENQRQQEEEDERHRRDEQSRLAAYGPRVRQEPGLRLGTSFGLLGAMSAGTGSSSFAMPLRADLTINAGAHHIQANATTGIAADLNLRAAAQYAGDLGPAQTIAGDANSDRLQGQTQLFTSGLFTGGITSSSASPYNSALGQAGVGYRFSGRTRATGLRIPGQAFRGEIRPRVTAVVGRGTQTRGAGDLATGLGLGVDFQGSAPVSTLGSTNDIVMSVEASASLTRGINFINSDNGILTGEANLGMCWRPSDSNSTFQGACASLQYAGQSIGDNGSNYGGLMGRLDWDWGARAHRAIASDADREAAPRPTGAQAGAPTNPTPHPAGQSAQGAQ